MKNISLIFLFILISSSTAFAQEKNFVYYLDKNLNSVPQKDAIMVGKGKKNELAFKLDCYLKYDNNLIMTFHFTDSTINTMQGLFTSYHKNGTIENNGTYNNNLEEGTWVKKDSLGRLVDSIIYKNGIKYNFAEWSYHTNNQISNYEFTDTLKNTFQYISYDSLGNKTAEANFIGNEAEYKQYFKDSIKITNVHTRDMVEAQYKGYSKYLSKNLDANVPAKNGAPKGIYNVVIRFIVDKEGNIIDVAPETNLGYGMEKEVMRIVKRSPKWQPASIFGIPIKAYRRQPITFQVLEQEVQKPF